VGSNTAHSESSMKADRFPFTLRYPQNSFRLAFSISLGFALFFLAFLPPGIYSIDGNSMLAVAESLVTNHDVSVPPGLGSVGADGRTYSNWYPLLSLLCLPLVAAARLCIHFVHLPFHYLAAVFAMLVQVPLTAATAGLVALLSLQLGATQRGAWLAAISFSLSTIALVYVRTFFAEPLLAFLFALGIYTAFRLTPRAILVCTSLTALAVLAKPTGILIGPILSAYLLAKHVPRWRALLPFAGSLCGFLLYAVYNQLRFHNPLQFGQPWMFSLSSLPSGLLGLLASPGWGLVWYCPPLLLAVIGFRLALRSKFWEASTIGGIFAAFILLHSFYTNWPAGWGWGPRYLVPVIPGLCALTGLLTGKARKALIVLSLAGFLINAPTLFGFYERYFAELQERNITPDATIAWSLPLAPFLHGWPAAVRQAQDASQHDVRDLFAQRGDPSQRIGDSRALRVVALWWWVLPIARIPRWIGFFVSVILVGAGLLVLIRSAPRRCLEQTSSQSTAQT
jgi:hypothetical protein